MSIYRLSELPEHLHKFFRPAGQIGLEASPDEHIAALVDVFREVRRVLRPDGTLWLNYGDAYASSSQQSGVPREDRDLPNAPAGWSNREQWGKVRTAVDGFKQKDLMMLPARLAIALQADGWWLRSEIIWAKPNPMPESVTDRPTSAHEKVFLLTPSPHYFYDAEAVREEGPVYGGQRGTFARESGKATQNQVPGHGLTQHRPGRVDRVAAGRNLRNVWTIPTQPFPEAHFATYPEALVRPCILAGTSEAGCCPECLAPWERVVEPTAEYARHLGQDWADDAQDRAEGRGHFDTGNGLSGQRRTKRKGASITAAYQTTGFRPTCTCPPGTPIPCTVLDPFAGSGTTGVVAVRHGRAFVGCELNPEYAAMARRRVDRAAKGLGKRDAEGQGTLFEQADLFGEVAGC